jgi:L-2,4-diaminobutyric acid acetyltransferase
MSSSQDLTESESTNQHKTTLFEFSPPASQDGIRVHRLIASCPPLDPNSIYCNILQCDHFADTSVKVERDGEIVAFISGYIPPNEPEVLFIWQVAVAESARGQGLGGRMLQHLVERPACSRVRYMHTTVTPDNAASGAMFEGFARRIKAPVAREVAYDRERHFDGKHDSEVRFIIGPFHSLS